MTIASTTTSIAYAGDGSATAFPVPFPFFDPGDLEVIERVVATGAETLKVLATHYAVSGGAGASGTVTALAAPPASVQWVIRRRTAAVQTSDYVPNDAFPADGHERALDRLTMLAQELGETLGRALLAPRSESLAMTLPPIPARAGRLLGFDVGGQPIAAAGSVPSTAVSPFSATLLDDVDALAARTTLGMPLHFANVHKGGIDQTGIADGVWTKLTFSTEVADTAGKYDPSTSRYTPGIAGWTLVIARAAWTSMEDQAVTGVHLYRNGFYHSPGGASMIGASGLGSYHGVPMVCIAEHGVSDYFEIFALWDGTGGTRSVSGASSQTFAQFLTLRQIV